MPENPCLDELNDIRRLMSAYLGLMASVLRESAEGQNPLITEADLWAARWLGQLPPGHIHSPGQIPTQHLPGIVQVLANQLEQDRYQKLVFARELGEDDWGYLEFEIIEGGLQVLTRAWTHLKYEGWHIEDGKISISRESAPVQELLAFRTIKRLATGAAVVGAEFVGLFSDLGVQVRQVLPEIPPPRRYNLLEDPDAV